MIKTTLSLALMIALNASAGLVTQMPTDSLFVCNTGIAFQTAETMVGTANLVVQFEDPTMPANSEARFISQVVSAPATGAYNQLFTTETETWSHNVLQNQMALSTEKFGAKYFVDVCYRGPLKSLAAGSTQDLSQGIYVLDLSVNLADPTANGRNYRNQASLATSVQVVCDLRGRGTQNAARGSDEIGVTQLEIDSLYSSTPQSWNSNSLNYQIALNDSNTTVPRFCRIRVFYNERATSTIRDQSLSPRDVDLFLNINRQ